MKKLLVPLILILAACQQPTEPPSQTQSSVAPDSERLAEVLEMQTEEIKARYQYRHPGETLEFFGIAPGMTVVEVLPGEGWYSGILVPYLGNKGKLIGADYGADMWPNFSFATEVFIQERQKWPAKWVAKAAGWGGENGAAAEAYTLKTLPDTLEGKADAVLFIRALHNLARFEGVGGYLTQALGEAYRVLKPGGIVGVVQHRAPDDKSDEWADGSKGYLKPEFVIEKMKMAGFEYLGETDVNANPKDQPGENDIVWRLPPGLYTSKDNPELQQQYTEIGESNRMTLKFSKPRSSSE